MRIRISNISIDNIIVSSVVVLFIWISFFPAPVQETYYFATNIFLGFVFLTLLLIKRVSIFRVKDYPLWIFITAIGINILFAQQKNIAIKTYLNLAIPMFAIYYVVSKCFSSEKRLYLLAKTICLSSIIVSLIAILESLFAFNPIYQHLIKNPYYLKYITGFVRPMSTQLDATALGGFLLGCLPFSFILFKKTTLFSKLLGATGIVLNTVVIILTLSRGALSGLIVIIALYLLVEKRYWLATIFLIIVFTSSTAFSYLPYPFSKLGIGGIVSNTISPKERLNMPGIKPMIEERSLAKAYNFDEFGRNWIYEDSIFSNYRLERLSMALRMLKDHPFKGLGFQHFRIRFYEYYSYKQKIPYDIMIADNMYLTILAETGIIGFLGFFIFIFSLFRKGWMKFNELSDNPGRKWLLMAGLMAFMGLLINMAGYELFYWINQYVFFCIITGFISASSNNFEPKERLNHVKA